MGQAKTNRDINALGLRQKIRSSFETGCTDFCLGSLNIVTYQKPRMSEPLFNFAAKESI